MKQTDNIYCLACGQIVPSLRAVSVFRTGYFRIETPLGCCEACYVRPVSDMFSSVSGSDLSDYSK
ncbi:MULTISPECIES: hypothetical protein [unclassified Paenibacillus]|uniref:hypothetical protein n=1 Tax=unclassified Paenibacillus TaxID=185978 RepID=UPI001C11F30B|nr:MULTISPECIES: hypothetical protein [unclassified Paenibacillus]MBU5443459.1 hypothetical protein [Paenibacillus sp. MSJ-34]CAH0119392.1 hypothetical protein PAE9249_01893 [Paenibacillus sp. CECT 9249]